MVIPMIQNAQGTIETLLFELQPKERLELIIKLIPYVLPKVNNVQYSLGEPLEWD